MSDRTLNVGIVGLEFGAEFIPIYQRHPNATMYAICQRTREKLDRVGDAFDVAVRYDDFDDMLADDDIDVIHINTPLQLHADQACMAMEAGKHVGCTIPMATTVEDCRRIVDTQQRTGRVYMMMETVLHSREFLYLQELFRTGELGKLQFLRSSHHQDMSGWPTYWDGMPPMLIGSHAISPLVGIGRNECESVQGLGSGTIYRRMHDAYGSPFAIESAHVRFRDSDLGAEATRHLWATARQYRESFDVYASRRTFEWSQVEGGSHLMHSGEQPEPLDVPDFAHLLPKEVAPFTTGGVFEDESHRAAVQGGAHGGSHPHLAHALLMAVLGTGDTYPDATQSANITCAGILAHESALAGGDVLDLPEWTFVSGNQPHVVELDESREPPWAAEPTHAG